MKQLVVIYLTLLSQIVSVYATWCGFCGGTEAKCDELVRSKDAAPYYPKNGDPPVTKNPHQPAATGNPYTSYECAKKEINTPTGYQYFWKSYKYTDTAYCTASHEWGFTPWRNTAWYAKPGDSTQGKDHCWRMCQTRGFQTMRWSWKGWVCTCEMAGKHHDFLGYKCGQFYDEDNPDTNKDNSMYQVVIGKYRDFGFIPNKGGRGFQQFIPKKGESFLYSELGRAEQGGFHIYGGYGKEFKKVKKDIRTIKRFVHAGLIIGTIIYVVFAKLENMAPRPTIYGAVQVVLIVESANSNQNMAKHHVKIVFLANIKVKVVNQHAKPVLQVNFLRVPHQSARSVRKDFTKMKRNKAPAKSVRKDFTKMKLQVRIVRNVASQNTNMKQLQRKSLIARIVMPVDIQMQMRIQNFPRASNVNTVNIKMKRAKQHAKKLRRRHRPLSM